MGDNTGIAWTDATWNPVTGCSKVSAGCKHCYAERVFPRAYHGQTVDVCRACRGRGCDACYGNGTIVPEPRRFTDVRCHPERLDQPLRWKRPRRVFVNSMSDLFHPDVPDEFIADVWARMVLSPQHTFQILTKRPERMQALLSGAEVYRVFECPLPNVWLGVSAEDQATWDERVPVLMATPAAVRFVSAEPLLGPIDLMLGDGRDPWRIPDWVIVGGESGPKARPMDLAWARSIAGHCSEAGVPVFVKQLGASAYEGTPVPGVMAQWHTRHRAGATMDEWPADLQVQEWPA